MKITYQMLVEKRACLEQLALFKRMFPDGTPDTLEEALKLVSQVAGEFDFDWAALHFLSAAARAAYGEATAAAWAAYGEAKAPAWAAYGEATAAARAAYGEATAAARAAYGEAKAPAWAAYGEAKAAAFIKALFGELSK